MQPADGGGSLYADLNGSNALQTRYLRGDALDQLFARITGGTGGTAAWYLADREGSVQNLTDDSGNLQDTITYDAFGNVLSESNASYGDRYKYTGSQLDSETGLQYDRARVYDSVHGRWLSQDPLGFSAGDTNLYRYVGNDPTGATDPSGLQRLLDSNGLSTAGVGPLAAAEHPAQLRRHHAGHAGSDRAIARRRSAGAGGRRIGQCSPEPKRDSRLSVGLRPGASGKLDQLDAGGARRDRACHLGFRTSSRSCRRSRTLRRRFQTKT